MILNILRRLCRMFQAPVRTDGLEEWARLEFRRGFHPTDLDGRL